MTVSVGQRVETIMKRRPTCRGTVLSVSLCGRYALVEKSYGRRKWSAPYLSKDLKVIIPRAPSRASR